MFPVKIFDTLHSSIELVEIVCSQRLDFILARSVNKQQMTYQWLVTLQIHFTETASSPHSLSGAILSLLLSLQSSSLCYTYSIPRHFDRPCIRNQRNLQLAAMLWWFTAAPKPLKIQVFWGSSSHQGSHSPYILGDTTRSGHVTCVLVWSKSDRRWLRKTLHKQADKQTDTTKIMVTWPWTNKNFPRNWAASAKALFHFNADFVIQSMQYFSP